MGRVKDVKDLFERFSVEVLTKAFYQELSDWYAWAIKVISFPNDITKHTDDKLHNHEGAIRLITRLIFVWFLKERKLIPWQFFDQKYIANHLIKGFNPHKIDNLSVSRKQVFIIALSCKTFSLQCLTVLLPRMEAQN